MKEIRVLHQNEIECRIGTISEKGLSLLLYKDARADMKILDEVYGSMHWQRRHEIIGENLYCIVSVWDEEKKQWVSKMDVGTESYTEKEKGQASDSFKRACFNWGIGRELYTAPFIWIPSNMAAIQKKGDKYYCNERFSVSSIAYDNNRTIKALEIINGKKQPVFKYQEKAAQKNFSGKQRENLEKELNRTGVSLQTVLDRYQISSIMDMTDDIYESAMKSLRKSKDKAAA